jgi:hypothetical protein
MSAIKLDEHVDVTAGQTHAVPCCRADPLEPLDGERLTEGRPLSLAQPRSLALQWQVPRA